jgi:23S rRNA (guanosine2251-2'-O)-methyltransferase
MKESDYIYGIHAVQEAILSGREINKILVGRNAREGNISELLFIAKKTGIPCQHVPPEKLNSFTRKNHQGVVAVLSPVIYQDIGQIIPQLFEDGELPFILVLDGITDVRNLGAIARSAECAGVHALVIPARGGALVTADAVKTSSGALNIMPVCRAMNLAGTVRFLKESGLTIYGSSEKPGRLYAEADYAGPLAIILGSEETGLSPELLNICDDLLYIPMYGRIESLNVSVAASLLVYEVVRQRKLIH